MTADFDKGSHCEPQIPNSKNSSRSTSSKNVASVGAESTSVIRQPPEVTPCGGITQNIDHCYSDSTLCKSADIERLLSSWQRPTALSSNQAQSGYHNTVIYGATFDSGEICELLCCDNPETELLGFYLPEHFDAVVLTAPTFATETPSPTVSKVGGSQPSDLWRTPSELVMVTARCGCIHALLSTPETTLTVTNALGWISDTCLRIVGQSTPEHGLSPVKLAEVIWLDRIMTTILSLENPKELTWTSIANLCPIPAGLSSRCVEALACSIAQSSLDWESARHSCITGMSRFQIVPAHIAKWMDTNMFARWCLSHYVDTSELSDDLTLLAPAWIVNQVRETISLAHDLYHLTSNTSEADNAMCDTTGSKQSRRPIPRGRAA